MVKEDWLLSHEVETLRGSNKGQMIWALMPAPAPASARSRLFRNKKN